MLFDTSQNEFIENHMTIYGKWAVFTLGYIIQVVFSLSFFK